MRQHTIPIARLACVGLLLVLPACGGNATPGTSAPSNTAAATTPLTSATSVADTTTTTPPTTTTAPPTTTTADPRGEIIEVTIADGAIEAPTRPRVARGDTVTIVVAADVEDEVHVHGYDLFLDVSPGSIGELTFLADIPGIFEVELETSHDLLFELEVN